MTDFEKNVINMLEIAWKFFREQKERVLATYFLINSTIFENLALRIL